MHSPLCQPPSAELLKLRARDLRARSTDAESLIWDLLRNRQLGVKFRRQHPFPPYILDFYCVESQICIETDGSQHYTPEGLTQDAVRTAYLESQEVRVIRFTNREVLQETEAVIAKIWDAISPTSPSPSPPEGGEGFVFW
jgi:very-short-patch-repair endonuclease